MGKSRLKLKIKEYNSNQKNICQPYNKWNIWFKKCRICGKKIKNREKDFIWIDGTKQHIKCIEKMTGRKINRKTKLITGCTCNRVD